MSLISLGVWLVLAPWILGYAEGRALSVGGREQWLSSRAMALAASDVASGLMLIFVGRRSLTRPGRATLWIGCAVGIWLSMAPFVLWAPHLAAYVNRTVAGLLVVVLTLLLPALSRGPSRDTDGEVPPGWTYNPSSWAQRLVMVVAGFAGWLVAHYLAAYQLGYLSRVWDPFFGESARRVLGSTGSHPWLPSDVGFAALLFTFVILVGCLGSSSRWRTEPWLVALFGLLVIPGGLVQLALTLSQSLMHGSWCSFGLLSAFITLVMIPLAADEIVAMGQELRRARRRGEPMWRVFWKGEPAEAVTLDIRTPEWAELPGHPARMSRASCWGISWAWTLVISACLGAWTMGISTTAKANPLGAPLERWLGGLIVVTSVVAMAEVLRLARYLNLALGLALAATGMFISASAFPNQLSDLAVGAAVAAMAMARGPKREQYGSWNAWVR